MQPVRQHRAAKPSPALAAVYPAAVSFGLLIALAASPALARTNESGLPGMETFSTAQMGGWGQTFSTCEDSQGVIYVADLKGLLIFDGERWETVIHPRRRSPFSLAVGKDDRIFIGFDGDIGYLDLSADRTPAIVSLKSALPDSLRNVGKVWYTIATPEGVLFVDDYRLYRWVPDPAQPGGGTMKTWVFPEGSWVRFLGRVHGHTYIVQRHRGLRELAADSLVTPPGGERLKEYMPIGYLPLENGRILFAGNNHSFNSDWLIYDGKTFTQFEGEITRLSKKYQGYACIVLPHGRFALATLRNGVAIFDGKGRILQKINRTTGLPDNAVQGLYLSRTGSIWVTMNYGLARIDDSDPAEYFDHRLGIVGNIMDIVRFEGKIYVATDQGVFRSHPATVTGAAMTFDRIAGADDWVWRLQPFGDRLLVAGSTALYEIMPNSLTAQTVEDSLSLESVAVAPDGKRVLLGTTYMGLRVIRREHGRWSYEGMIADWPNAIRRIYTPGGGTFWISYDDASLKRIQLGFLEPEVKVFEVEDFDTSSGLPIDDYYWPVSYNHRIYASGLRGLFRFDPSTRRFSSVQLVDETGHSVQRELSNPKFDSAGDLWFCNGTAPLSIASPVSPDTFRMQSVYLEGALRTVDALWFDKDNSLWAGGGLAKLIHLRNPERKPLEPVYPPLIGKVLYKKQAIYSHLLHLPLAMPKLPYHQNYLEFQYSLPQSLNREGNEYQYRIVGLDSTWSEWARDSHLGYTHVPVGRYTFQVRGRVMHGRPSEPVGFAFRILPPWYMTTFAYIGYGLLLIAFIYGYSRFRIRQLIERNRQLEQVLDQRAREAVEQYEHAQKAELEAQRMRTANQLAATIAHEFNNPLAILNGMCDLYDMKEFEKREIDQMTHRIRNQVTRMSGLVDRLMSIEELREIDYAAGFKIFDLHSKGKGSTPPENDSGEKE